MTEVPVLIVGGSLVGLSTAMLLGHHGIRSLVVEHHRGTAIHPRAAQVTQRSMEIFRQVGVEQVIRSRSDEQFVQDGAIMAVETLAGKELAYFIANLNEGIRDVSPCERVFISQTLLEPLLKVRAEELGATLRFATEMVSFTEDNAGVTATIADRDTGDTNIVRARYMVAADGAHSRVRQWLGIRTLGRGTFARSATIYFQAEVAPLLRGRNLSVIYVNNPTQRAFIRVEKPFDRGFLAITGLGDPAQPVTDVAAGLDEARAIELVRNALGVDDIAVRIDDIMRWDAAADTADQFQQNGIFLAGDAAHVMPPHGGFGGNTGIQDAHNLAWKLAMTLRGEAGPRLLSSYDTERRPVGHMTAEQAYARYVTRTAPYLAANGHQPVLPDLDVELGYGYDSSVLVPDPDDAPALVSQNPRETHGRPGTRAPHVWLDENRTSTIDWFGQHFVLVTGPAADGWRGAVENVAGRGSVHIDVHPLDATTAGAFGLEAAGAALVRPDGFVAWRSPRAGAGSAADTVFSALRTATGFGD